MIRNPRNSVCGGHPVVVCSTQDDFEYETIAASSDHVYSAAPFVDDAIITAKHSIQPSSTSLKLPLIFHMKDLRQAYLYHFQSMYCTEVGTAPYDTGWETDSAVHNSIELAALVKSLLRDWLRRERMIARAVISLILFPFGNARARVAPLAILTHANTI